MEPATFSWSEVADHLLRLGAAFLLALPLGLDRERRESGPGLRTFPLVAIGSCAFLLIGRSAFGDDGQFYILYGLMTGIGFIGGGSILKERGSVSGTATAASIWNTGAIGAGVAWDRYEISLALAVVNFAVLRFGAQAKDLVPKDGGAEPPRSGDAH
ncbi:MAG TPA: MgtC/SapB family protein [Myxococcota bacterium]|nr:MgtC/SapB family protein [Myxococcota bacterium]